MTRALTVCAVVVSLFSTATLSAASIDRARADRANERIVEAAEQRARVRIDGLPLGKAALDTIELEPMKVWADDAKIVVDHGAGSVEQFPIPAVTFFRGRIAGDPDSAVFLSVERGAVDGLAITGTGRRFKLATGRPAAEARVRRTDPLFVRELDDAHDAVQPDSKWTCAVEKAAVHQSPSLLDPSAGSGALIVGDATVAQANINVGTATYTARVDVDTDFELYGGFGSVSALTTYITNLVGATSVIYQRDFATTLILGTVRIRDTAADPWATAPATHNTGQALGEFGTYYHNNYPLASNRRSVAVLLSGKSWGGGVAWTDIIGEDDFFCGATGANCGSAQYANQYAGAYAFVGSSGVITTTLPDPNATINGVQYRLPNNNNYWILLAFAHEIGHSVAAPHSNCVTLTAQEQAQYGVTRTTVDQCPTGEGSPCYSGSIVVPAELGTVMSYCHIAAGLPSRYLFGKAGETSEKMLTILNRGMDENTGGTEANGATTAVGTITMAGSLSCAAGQTATVQPCASGTPGGASRACTYAWQITGGTIQGSTTGTSISFTPNAASVTVTVTLTNANLMSMTTTKTSSASCAAVTAPVTTTATATTATNVLVSWSAVTGATSYQIHRSSNGSTFAQVGTSATTAFNDSTAAANTAYLYKVCAVNGSAGPFGPNDVATTVIFTDDPLSAGTITKGVHMTQLRTAVTAMRTLAALSVPTYTDPTITTAIPLKAAHVTELRANLTAARTALSLPALPSFTDPTLTAGVTAPKAVHLTELRNGVK